MSTYMVTFRDYDFEDDYFVVADNGVDACKKLVEMFPEVVAVGYTLMEVGEDHPYVPLT